MLTRSLFAACRKYALVFAIASVGLLQAIESHAADASFVGSTLSLPEVHVGGKFYSANLMLTNSNPLEFTVTGATLLGAGTLATASTFEAGVLVIPRVTVNGKTYSAQLALISSPPLVFRLTSATLLSDGTGGTGGGGVTVGSCVYVPYPPTGVVAAYKFTSIDGVLDYTDEYLQISDTLQTMRSVSNLTVGGIAIHATALTQNVYAVRNNLRYISTIIIDSTGNGLSTQVTSIFTPAFLVGPLHEVCEQQKWDTGSVSTQITMTGEEEHDGLDFQIVTTVEDVAKYITLSGGGAFLTVQYRYFYTVTGETKLAWFERSSGRLVKSQAFDAAGKLQSTTEFQGIR